MNHGHGILEVNKSEKTEVCEKRGRMKNSQWAKGINRSQSPKSEQSVYPLCVNGQTFLISFTSGQSTASTCT